MSLPQAIKTMLNDVASVSNDETTYGSRNQGGALPAITFTIDSVRTISIGATPLRHAAVTIKSIAETAEDAQSIAADVEEQLDTGTYNSIVFSAVLNQNSTLEAGEPSSGDETTPFTCVTTADIFYKE